ncbi:hypothetical protein SDRG_12820 [Saprolegnia diclina VS20]|uniref:Tubby C-terminal domain-containing protein n=1 Tax=Saprolegnia diclina (strain VS20) TaxID=1156394 RepID=T0Q434_SAPDV|nr:hypothetical protein SDRG_12820 [Saprolegnia diclina VS20]EQC29356.1 hypothetical protein SDRG_12820 [Saprolegnia diclina VS20]|eukprot:XP_008617123.1 hypothetical protein SDRG_12820 [Saprolegnia diclina VS20]
MGACMSDEPIPVPLLVAPSTPITAVDPRFVLKTPMRLHARYDWSNEGRPFCIKDVATGAPYFIVDGALGPCHNRKTLRDAKGVEVAVMDEPWTSGGRRDVSRINNSGEATSLVFSFDTTFFLVCTDVRCEFVDLVTKQRHELTGSGSVGTWSMVFRCDGHVIATFEMDATLSDKYFLHVAAGVDLALIVLLLTFQFEALNNKNKNNMGACMSDENVIATPLVVPPTPITAVDPKFVLQCPMRLNIRHNDWVNSGEFRVKDAATGIPYSSWSTARSERSFSLGHRDVLRTNGRGEATSHIFGFDVTNFFGSTDLTCEFVDVMTKQRHVLTASGSVGSWNMVFRCDGHAIAKFESDWTLSGDKYIVDIAPGVDLALIVLLCVGVQEASE